MWNWKKAAAKKVKEEVVPDGFRKPGRCCGRGSAGRAKDFGSYLGSNVMPSKGVIKGSDNCAHISL